MHLLCSEYSSLAFSVVLSILPLVCDNIVASSFSISGFFWHRVIVPGATDIQQFLTWLHRAEQVSCVKCNSFHIYILVCLNRPPVSIALKERQPEITQGHTFFWELQCSNSAISRDFGWKLRHCLLSSECWLEKYLKLIVQSREWLSSFKKGVQGLSLPALDTPPTIFFCFLPHTHKHLLLHISSALSSSSCIRYLILWSSWNSWHKT